MEDEKILREENILDDNLGNIDLVTQKSEDEEEKYFAYSGKAISASMLYPIMSREKTKLIFLAGPAGSGKTTIETSIYQIFLSNPVEGLSFAGSRTLMGLEERAFYTRVVSGGSLPATPRTSSSAEEFLHLRIKNDENDHIVNLLLADISGEKYKNCIGDVKEIQRSFPAIKQADFLVGVLDGETLADKKKKRGAVRSFLDMMRTFHDADVIPDSCNIQVVFSKMDLFVKDNPDAEVQLDKIRNQVQQNLSRLFHEVRFFEVAAMPVVRDVYKVGEGLEPLLKEWIFCGKKKQKSGAWTEAPSSAEKLSEYDRLAFKLMGGK